MLTLDKLKIDNYGIINSINCEKELRRRLLDLGMIVGAKIKPILVSPFRRSCCL